MISGLKSSDSIAATNESRVRLRPAFSSAAATAMAEGSPVIMNGPASRSG